MTRTNLDTLNIIGPGRVGRTFGRLWHETGTFRLGDVLARSPEHARAAVEWMGSGRPIARLEDARPAKIWMASVPDAMIRACGERLADSRLVRPTDIVFHLSGALQAAELAPLDDCAHVASIHPLKTFADAAAAVSSFSGTYCIAEGEPAALAVLVPAFQAIGARVSRIDPASKPVYHAAGVIVCNYLVALMETGLKCYERAGIPRETATAMMEPLVRETVNNVFALGTRRALTGPVARGDVSVVASEMKALDAWDPAVAGLYRTLGAAALDLARADGAMQADALERLESLLKSKPR